VYDMWGQWHHGTSIFSNGIQGIGPSFSALTVLFSDFL
jgi:hypothetical protein